jgi:hypothetical protein
MALFRAEPGDTALRIRASSAALDAPDWHSICYQLAAGRRGEATVCLS